VVPQLGDWRCFYRGLSTSIRTRQPPQVDAMDALTVLQLIEASRRSSEQRCRVNFIT
jgi:predicted dehydrogenase